MGLKKENMILQNKQKKDWNADLDQVLTTNAFLIPQWPSIAELFVSRSATDCEKRFDELVTLGALNNNMDPRIQEVLREKAAARQLLASLTENSVNLNQSPSPDRSGVFEGNVFIPALPPSSSRPALPQPRSPEKQDWTQKEDRVLKGLAKMVPHWSMISQLVGRSDEECKVRFRELSEIILYDKMRADPRQTSKKVSALTKERDTLPREENKKSGAAAVLKEKEEIIKRRSKGEQLPRKQAAPEGHTRKLKAQEPSTAVNKKAGAAEKFSKIDLVPTSNHPAPVDREKTCPLLIRVFTKVGGHHSDRDFAARGKEPKDEFHVYTWIDATLYELADLIKEVAPEEARREEAILSFALVYPDKCGVYVVREVGRLPESGSQTLGNLGFEIGDYLDVAILLS